MSLVNGTFETWNAGNPDPWVVTGPGTVTQDTTHQRSGASCASLVVAAGVRVDQTMTATPGLIYTSSYWFNGAAGQFPFLRITANGGASNGFMVQSDFSWGSGFAQFSNTNGTGSYVNVSVVAQALPAGVTSITIGIGGATFFLDDVTLDAPAPSGPTRGSLVLLGVGA